MGIDLKKIENLGIEKVLRRGSAEILERDDEGIFLFDTVSEAYMIFSLDNERAKQWILKHSDRHYTLFAVTGESVADFVAEQFGFPNILKCHQFAYFGEEPRLSENGLTVRTATLRDMDFIIENYDLLSENEFTKIIMREKLMLGELDGKPVGFVGEHLEGSMGILFVLPAYRNRGFATYLEKYQMKKMLKEGYIPFGQVVVGNEKSFNLQKKIGLQEGAEYVYWFF